MTVPHPLLALYSASVVGFVFGVYLYIRYGDTFKEALGDSDRWETEIRIEEGGEER